MLAAPQPFFLTRVPYKENRAFRLLRAFGKCLSNGHYRYGPTAVVVGAVRYLVRAGSEGVHSDVIVMRPDGNIFIFQDRV